jgi:hypothetical protein
MQDFEKLGVFYLGREYDIAKRAGKPDNLLLYQSKDLTTHAVCVGMTGSGKTGLCLALLEEAAIDGIPAIAIDPKGDIGNLLLTFPDLKPDDFAPWIDPSEAQRNGVSNEEYAAKTAKKWSEGLAAWGEDGKRIAKFRDSVDISIYTPGSNAGLPLTVLRSFAAPSAAVLEDEDAMRERVSATVSGVLSLAGVEADPIRGREHILLSNILDHAWRAGKSLELSDLLRQIQNPPFDKVGFVDLETFFPAKQRFELAMSLNNLLASPAFAGWLTGEPLDIGRLLYTPAGKPRLSILSIAHLGDSERMFFVTILLNELLSWSRAQSGTSSLRAIFYMDEVYGYFPPSASPPSKKPMLTLLKQARAFGLGIVLATQNPVDLDYKGLANAGTWLLGRLQTERDKARLLDGLEGAASEAGGKFDRSQIAAALSSLGNRVFLLNNVHDDHPVVFESRWTLSYLRGPLTRDQIATLMKNKKATLKITSARPPELGAPVETPNATPSAQRTDIAAGLPPVKPTPTGVFSTGTARPILPAGITETFLFAAPPRSGETLVYHPALLGKAKLHFVAAKNGVDAWRERAILADVSNTDVTDPWSAGQTIEISATEEPHPEFGFAAIPSALSNPKNYAKFAKTLKDHLYSTHVVTLLECKSAKQVSKLDESEADFRIRLSQQARERRDAEMDKLRSRYAPKFDAINKQIDKAQQKAAEEKSAATHGVLGTYVSAGFGILEAAILRRKITTRENIRRAESAVKSTVDVIAQHGVSTSPSADIERFETQKDQLNAEVNQKIAAFDASVRPDAFQLGTIRISPRKADIAVESVLLAWAPLQIGEQVRITKGITSAVPPPPTTQSIQDGASTTSKAKSQLARREAADLAVRDDQGQSTSATETRNSNKLGKSE